MNKRLSATSRLARRLERLVHKYQIREYRERRDAYYPFSFNVKMYCALDFERAFAELVKQEYVNTADAIVCLGDLSDVKEVWANHDLIYDYIIDDMREQLTGTDVFRSVRPSLERKWKVDSSKCWDVKYGFAGRSGGHLVIEEFEGHNRVEMEPGNIHEYFSEECLRKLCAMLEEVALSVAKREEEFHYQSGFQLGQLIERVRETNDKR